MTQSVEAPALQKPVRREADGKNSRHISGPRRVFFLLDSFMLGGTETQAVELARRLDPGRFHVTLGCLRREGPLLDRLAGSHVKVVEVAMGQGIDSPSGMLGVLRLARLFRKERVEIVHAHDLWSNLVGMAAVMLARVPVSITSQRDLSHDAWYGTYRRRILRFFQGRSSIVVTNANAIRDGLVTNDGLRGDKVCVIHNGVDLEKFENVKANRELMFPGSAEKKLVVLVGNMISTVKGHSELILAANDIVKLHPGTRFVLVGEGPKRSEFESQVQAAGLKENFYFLGRRSDIPAILACCDIAVLPSHAEGMPNAVLEYMAAGLPVVASALGGNLEIIQDSVSGLLVPPQDAKALSEALSRLLSDDHLALRLAKAARERIVHSFSFEHLVEEVSALYSRLLANVPIT